jgi:hypothetical protein
MTIPDEASPPAVENTGPPPGPRVTRPALDREAPIRNWATLFGPAWAGPAGAAESHGSTVGGAVAGGSSAAPGGLPGQTLSDAVGQGYRVINEYIAQGQRYAEAMRFPDWSNWLPGASPAGPNAAFSNPEMQQLFRRMMQYGMDFAGMWFEVWNRMGSPPPSGWAAPPGSAQPPWPSSPAGEAPAAAASERAKTTPFSDGGPSRVLICVSSERRTESMLELRRGSGGPLLAHALRPEGHDAPAISSVTIEVQADGAVRVSVDVPSNQAPGVYNGMIVDSASNLPRGTLTVRIIESAHGSSS